jgi:phosphate transport system protein
MDANIITPHISRRYNQDLENIFNKVLAMGGSVEEQVSRSFECVRTSDESLAREVIGMDRFINRQQAVLDEMCVRLLARQQPAAIDLRLIIAALHIITNLERIGDETTKLAKAVINLRALDTVDCCHVPGYPNLVEMTECAQDMLKITLDAFAHLDVRKAMSLLPKEAAADKAYSSAKILIRDYMMQEPSKIPSMLEILQALRAMERVTDHALNIGEYVFYVIEGEEMRQISTERLHELSEKYAEAND